MPTRRGRVLIASGVVLYVAALATAIDELYALALAAIMLPLCSMVFVRWSRHRISFRRGFAPRRVFAGGSIRVEIEVRNLSRVATPPLFLEDGASGALNGPLSFAVPSLGAEDHTLLGVDRKVPQRGRYVLGPLKARLVDPFGLAAISHDVAERSSFVCYPHVDALAEGSPPEERSGGGRSLIQRLAIGGDDFYAVRGWQEGDDLRMIHWRSTARRNELMIRQDEVRPFPRATVFIDTRRAQHGGGSSLEWAISSAASITWELARQGFALRLATADGGPGGARWGREATDP